MRQTAEHDKGETRKKHMRWIVAVWAGAALSSCGGGTQETATVDEAQPPATVERTATADLQPASGSNVRGTVTFTQTTTGVRVQAELTGLPPGEHGFHVHETGDCSAPDGASAGAHYNPTAAQHGAPDAASRHMGDLGNITAGDDSTAHYDRMDTQLTLEGEHSVVGKAVIVHAAVDDMSTHPSGNAGARVACGVVR